MANQALKTDLLKRALPTRMAYARILPYPAMRLPRRADYERSRVRTP
jgi:hypothetical protein